MIYLINVFESLIEIEEVCKVSKSVSFEWNLLRFWYDAHAGIKLMIGVEQ